MSFRARTLLLLPLLGLTGCRFIATVLLLPFVAFAWICSAFVGSDGLTNQEELRAGGIRIDEHVVEFRIAEDLTYEGTIETVRTVTSTAGLVDAQTACYTFDPRTETLELEEAEVINPDGTRLSVDASAVFTRPSVAAQGAPSFVATETRTVLFPQLRVGSQTHVKWSFKETGRSILGFNYSWRPSFTLPVGHARIRLVYDTELPLRFETRGPFEVVQEEDGDERVIEATLNDYVGQVPEKAMVSPADLTPLFVATTVQSWEEIGARFYTAIEDKLVVTPEIKALASKIVGDHEGFEAAREIHRWVCNNIEYVAVYLRQTSGWVPHTAEEVLANGYGDCKDQFVLLASLLAARGIPAQAVLVNYDRSFEPLPISSPIQFDHCMAYLPQFDVYSNPIDRFRDLGELDTTLSGKFVVIATREGRTARTPEGSADTNRYRVEHQVALGADGLITGRTTMELGGRPSGRLRRTLALAASTEQAADDLLAETPRGGYGQLQTTDPSDLDVPLHCTGEWTSDVPVAMGKLIHFTTPTGIDLMNPGLVLQFISANERRYPALIAAIEVSSTHTLSLPKGYAFIEVPESHVTRNAAGQFESRYTLGSDGTLTVERKLRIEHDRYSAEAYPWLREILLACSTDMSRIVSAQLQL